jgi:hypothetical protein
VQHYNLDEANKIRESVGRKPLTPEQADLVLRRVQGNAPVRDAAAFMQAVVNAEDIDG